MGWGYVKGEGLSASAKVVWRPFRGNALRRACRCRSARHIYLNGGQSICPADGLYL